MRRDGGLTHVMKDERVVVVSDGGVWTPSPPPLGGCEGTPPARKTKDIKKNKGWGRDV